MSLADLDRVAVSASADDADFMAAALSLGRRVLGRAAPNPAVGAIVVRDGIIVGRGWTRDGGRPHAETEALDDAGAAARGAIMYVGLEPCSHHGRTPPCADAIIAAGIARVVSALEDPDPRVAGRGHARLREAGIEVLTGIGAEGARRANLGHILRVTEGRPMVTLKLAETADGFAAGGEHDKRLAITGPAANARVHVMRAMHDAIMVGIGTARADDPLMTVRLPGMEDIKPLRVVLDYRLEVSPRSRLASTARDYPTLVIAAEDAPLEAERALAGTGIEVARIPAHESARLELRIALAVLAQRGITRVFSEGGPRVAKELIGAGLADEVAIFTAPKPFGAKGVPVLAPAARRKLGDGAHYTLADDSFAGPDRLRRYNRVL
ncbi:MAG: bifunctional diaminohydroxyphosphoribosylaminopyrimidine deaminase/5-amino-6-(5-phosphoribosylamino)uracil reductase RibD [Methylobacteriaceae bacterium]|nr:bifunctional diaminohydroxyphosphoribosylaminopyrimidine deaminase/5-amino-6-(5-phosphoribosylamino)uracil reductase RibD [Methylobacteriaceae bacterium]